MDLGETPTGLKLIQYSDGSRSKVSRVSLKPLPDNMEK